MAAGNAKSDLLWVVGVLVVLGVMWWVGGGPSRPEATQGPFLQETPTSRSATPGGQRESVSRQGEPPAITAPLTATSSWYGQVKVRTGNARSEIQPNQEYIVLEVRSANKEPINISGWQLVTGSSGRVRPEVVKIPFAAKLFVGGSQNPARDQIILAPGERAAITTGWMPNSDPFPINASFKVNRCSGYLDRLPNYRFVPSLFTSCPPPQKEPGVEWLDADCYGFIRRLATCHTPKFERRADGYDYVDGKIDRLSRPCRDFVKSHFSYNGCIAWHSADQDFWGREWRVYLNHTGELWHQRFETMALYDQSGRLVDQVSYRD